MNYLDDYREVPWLLSKPVSRINEKGEREEGGEEEEESEEWEEEEEEEMGEELEEEQMEEQEMVEHEMVEQKMKEQAEEEEEVVRVPLLKIKPLVWARFPRDRKYIIIRMESKFLDKAAAFLEENFFKYDILCKGVDLMRHEEAIEYYKDLMKYWLRDRTSLIAIEEGCDRIVGMLIARVYYLTKNKQNLDVDYSRIGICNARVQEIQDLRTCMRKQIIKVTALERVVNKCLEIKLFCVDRVEIIADDIENRLLKSVFILACECKVSLLIGGMSSLHEQELMRAYGFTEALAVNYEDLVKGDYVLFPSKEPETSFIGFFRFIEDIYVSPFATESIIPKRKPSDQLPVDSSKDSLLDPENEPYRMVNLYLDKEESETFSIEPDESYKNIQKLRVEYFEETLEEHEEEEFSEYILSEHFDLGEYLEEEEFFFLPHEHEEEMIEEEEEEEEEEESELSEGWEYAYVVQDGEEMEEEEDDIIQDDESSSDLDSSDDDLDFRVQSID